MFPFPVISSITFACYFIMFNSDYKKFEAD